MTYPHQNLNRYMHAWVFTLATVRTGGIDEIEEA